MKFLLKKHQNWKGLQEDIDKYVEKCLVCSKTGGALRHTKNRVIITSYPNEL